jgi:hypothetical protein
MDNYTLQEWINLITSWQSMLDELKDSDIADTITHSEISIWNDETFTLNITNAIADLDNIIYALQDFLE